MKTLLLFGDTQAEISITQLAEKFHWKASKQNSGVYLRNPDRYFRNKVKLENFTDPWFKYDSCIICLSSWAGLELRLRTI